MTVSKRVGDREYTTNFAYSKQSEYKSLFSIIPFYDKIRKSVTKDYTPAEWERFVNKRIDLLKRINDLV